MKPATTFIGLLALLIAIAFHTGETRSIDFKNNILTEGDEDLLAYLREIDTPADNAGEPTEASHTDQVETTTPSEVDTTANGDHLDLFEDPTGEDGGDDWSFYPTDDTFEEDTDEEDAVVDESGDLEIQTETPSFEDLPEDLEDEGDGADFDDAGDEIADDEDDAFEEDTDEEDAVVDELGDLETQTETPSFEDLPEDLENEGDDADFDDADDEDDAFEEDTDEEDAVVDELGDLETQTETPSTAALTEELDDEDEDADFDDADDEIADAEDDAVEENTYEEDADVDESGDLATGAPAEEVEDDETALSDDAAVTTLPPRRLG